MSADSAPHLHICLISDQLLPNLLPILVDRPDRVLLLVSDVMQQRGLHTRLLRMLQTLGIPGEVRAGIADSGLARIEEDALDVATRLDQADQSGWRLTLNLSCGNKLMALAFHRVFVDQLGERSTVIYTDTAHGCIEVLHPSGQAPRPLGEQLDLSTALAAQGASISRTRGQSSDAHALLKQRAELTRALARELSATSNGDALGRLNRLARGALDTRGVVLSTARQALDGRLLPAQRQLLEHCAKLGMLRIDADHIEFLYAEAARYLCGAWLEDYAWLGAHEARPHQYDCGVEVNWDGTGRGPLPNEFDLLAVHHNRLLIVECKTAGFGPDPDKAADHLYKLDSLADAAGGLFGTALLLSARDLSVELHKRAARLRIKVLDGERILELRDWLHAWQEGRA
jgi:hypothetical protein